MISEGIKIQGKNIKQSILQNEGLLEYQLLPKACKARAERTKHMLFNKLNLNFIIIRRIHFCLLFVLSCKAFGVKYDIIFNTMLDIMIQIVVIISIGTMYKCTTYQLLYNVLLSWLSQLALMPFIVVLVLSPVIGKQ